MAKVTAQFSPFLAEGTARLRECGWRRQAELPAGSPRQGRRRRLSLGRVGRGVRVRVEIRVRVRD